MEAILELRGVSKYFAIGLFRKSLIRAVDDVSFTVHQKEIVGILGESGSGKSTIAKMILKILRPDKGSIIYRERDAWKIEDREYYKRVQGVFQDPFSSFNPRRIVSDIFRDVLANYTGIRITSDKELADILNPVLSKVGLSARDIAGKYPHEFSGGQLQRLSIARALLVGPELIVADEPVSMVDASTRIDILNIFIDLKELEGVSSIIIGHDLSLANYVSDKVIVLYKGQVVEEGPSDILVDPAHPYTKMLAESVPKIDSKWSERLRLVNPGQAGPIHRDGCVFAERCPFKMDKCISQSPPLVRIGRSRVKCWLYAGK
jgi:peptide/nickel transport system ATP-binding protein